MKVKISFKIDVQTHNLKFYESDFIESEKEGSIILGLLTVDARLIQKIISFYFFNFLFCFSF